jgi:hypothetical protein
MSTEQPPHSAPPGPITSLDDPRAIQMLSTEHWSQLSARSLAYNEAFVRGGMFLTFLSMSFVALALLAQGMSFGDEFLTVAAIVLAFDLVVGLTTYARISGANIDDLRALHGMARIRHGYVEVAPVLEPYFTAPTYDDVDSVLQSYGKLPESGFGQMLYALSTSGGMIGMIVSMVGGVLAGVLALMVLSADLAVWIGLLGAVVTFGGIAFFTFGAVPAQQERLVVRFPARGSAPATTDASSTPDD